MGSTVLRGFTCVYGCKGGDLICAGRREVRDGWKMIGLIGEVGTGYTSELGIRGSGDEVLYVKDGGFGRVDRAWFGNDRRGCWSMQAMDCITAAKVPEDFVTVLFFPFDGAIWRCWTCAEA